MLLFFCFFCSVQPDLFQFHCISSSLILGFSTVGWGHHDDEQGWNSSTGDRTRVGLWKERCPWKQVSFSLVELKISVRVEFSHQTFQLVSTVWLKLIWFSVLIICLQSFASSAVPSLTPAFPEFHPMQSWFLRSSSCLWINCRTLASMHFIQRMEGEKRINSLVEKIRVKMIFGLHCSVSTLSHHVTGNNDRLLQCLMFWPKSGGLSIMYIWDTLKPYSLYFSFSFACKCKINLFQRLKYGMVLCFSFTNHFTSTYRLDVT